MGGDTLHFMADVGLKFQNPLIFVSPLILTSVSRPEPINPQKAMVEKRIALLDKVIGVWLNLGYFTYWVFWLGSMAFFGAGVGMGIIVGLVGFGLYVAILYGLEWYEKILEIKLKNNGK